MDLNSQLGTMNGELAREEEELAHAEEEQDLEYSEEEQDLEYSEEELSKLFPKIGDITNPNWQWPCYDQWRRPNGTTGIRICSDTNTKLKGTPWPFEVVHIINREGQKTVFLRLRSLELAEVVRKSNPQIDDDEILVGEDISPEQIFLRRQGLDEYIASSSATADANQSQTVLYAQHLLRFIREHFKDTLEKYERMKKECHVSYDMLWTFLVPNVEVCYRCKISNQQCHGKVRHANYSKCCLEVELTVMDYDAEGYKECTIDHKIYGFRGEVPFCSLNICPMSFYDKDTSRALEARFLAMGTLFYELAMKQPYRFLQYKGSLSYVEYVYREDVLRKLNADGRVMIDLLSFARMNPDYEMGHAKPPYDIMVGTVKPVCPEKPEDKKLMMSPAIVYGFSFRLKKWGCFEIFGLQEITFNEGAFDALKLRNPIQKMMLKVTTAQYVLSEGPESHDSIKTNVDPISGKGKGCIVLCHGPPGTGKTLTAEALSEEMKRPLWAVSSFELGTTPDELEKHLISVLDVATTWKAILLLDEADAYLERRDEGVDVTRNLMTGVFLRVLEYHKGVLFLTTNRVKSFDDAILSRMTLVISYPQLSDEQRMQIWKTSLARAGLCDSDVIQSQALVEKHPFNGRQIRNIIHIACLSAGGRKDTINVDDVRNAISIFLDGITSLSTII